MTSVPGLVLIVGTLQVGGAERQLYAQCEILSAAGPAPTVVYFEDGPWRASLHELGAQLIDLSSKRSRWARLAAVVSVARRSRCRVVQSSHGFTNVYAAVAARLLRIPSIGALRGAPAATAAELGHWAGPAFRWPTVVAGNSRACLEELARWGVEPADRFYLPNAVDPQRFAVRARSTHGPVTVGFVGRLTEAKHPELVVDVVADLAATGLEVRGLIVGDGPLVSLVDERRRVRGVEEMVDRRAPTEDVAAALGEMDVLMLPSDHEGMPNVILEAMSTGLPVVATRVGSVAEAVEDGRTGLLVEPRDHRALGAAVRLLVDDPEMRSGLGHAASERARTEFSPSSLAAAMSDLYDMVGST